jgi:hypothetical protein
VVQEVRIPERKSALEKIAQGLSVASSIMGIKSQWEQSKVNELKMKEYEASKAKQEKLSQNIFDDQEAKNLYEASADDPRAQQGFKEIKKPTGDVELKSFWFISPERIKQQASMADLSEQERRTRLETQYSEGRLKPNDYDNNITVYGGRSPGSGFRQGWDIIQQPDGSTKRVDVWIKPMRRQSLEGMGQTTDGLIPAMAPGGKKMPLITMKDLKTPEEKAGYRNAIDAAVKKGIPAEEIPFRISIDDVYAYNPKKIERDRADIAKQMKSYNELLPTIRQVDKVIGGIDSDKPINGSQEMRNATKLGMASGLMTRFGVSDPNKLIQASISKTSPESQRLFTSLKALQSDFNKLKSGMSLTASELAAAENALGVNEWATDAQLRQGIKTFLSVIKSGVDNVESGYHQASVDAYKQSPKSLTGEHPIFQRLDSNKAVVTTPTGQNDINRNDAINFGGG